MAVVAAFPANPKALADTYCLRGYDTRSPSMDDLSDFSKNGCRCVKRSENTLDCIDGCDCQVLNCRSSNVCGAIKSNKFFFEGGWVHSSSSHSASSPLGAK